MASYDIKSYSHDAPLSWGGNRNAALGVIEKMITSFSMTQLEVFNIEVDIDIFLYQRRY